MIVSFLHQKGGTGKSTLAIAAAIGLAQRRRRVLLLDLDYQGTSSDWGNAFGERHGVEVRSFVQPVIDQEIGRFRRAFDCILLDGPPSLSEMTESILRASERVIVPVRPALPDLWALTWLAAIIGKMSGEGRAPAALLVFNQHQGEALAPLRRAAQRWDYPVAEAAIPAHPAFPALYRGETLPAPLQGELLRLLELDGAF